MFNALLLFSVPWEKEKSIQIYFSVRIRMLTSIYILCFSLSLQFWEIKNFIYKLLSQMPAEIWLLISWEFQANIQKDVLNHAESLKLNPETYGFSFTYRKKINRKWILDNRYKRKETQSQNKKKNSNHLNWQNNHCIFSVQWISPIKSIS